MNNFNPFEFNQAKLYSPKIKDNLKNFMHGKGNSSSLYAKKTILTKYPKIVYFHCTTENGKIIKKEERIPKSHLSWEYNYDKKGHLLTSHCNGTLFEQYEYNDKGARIRDWCLYRKGEKIREFHYDTDENKLVQAGNIVYFWAPNDSLAAMLTLDKINGNVSDAYEYGYDAKLVSAKYGEKLTRYYEYDGGIMPVRVYYNNILAQTYIWTNSIQLAAMEDKYNGISYEFLYSNDFTPEQVILSGEAYRIAELTGIKAKKLLLRIGVDPLNSIRALVTTHNIIIKTVSYGSFGNILYDTNQKLKFPLGFACGLTNCIPNGLIRFGHRDYDPNVGRFVCKDPLGDTGGDHDLYDYCVDDPINKFDPTGLLETSIWNEEDHPRDDIGRFAEKEGEGADVAGSALEKRLADILKILLGIDVNEEGGLDFSQSPKNIMQGDPLSGTLVAEKEGGTVSDQGGGIKHTGKPLSPKEGQQVVDEAKTWLGTKYAFESDTDYAGAKAERGTAADCSGSTWKIYKELGFDYEYRATKDFPKYAATSGAFQQVDKPQSGDVGYWNGHVAIYVGEDNKGQPIILTTSSGSKEKTYKYNNPNYLNLGENIVKWYRYRHVK